MKIVDIPGTQPPYNIWQAAIKAGKTGKAISCSIEETRSAGAPAAMVSFYSYARKAGLHGHAIWSTTKKELTVWVTTNGGRASRKYRPRQRRVKEQPIEPVQANA